MSMAEISKLTVRFDGRAAMRDPLFWLDMIITKVTFGKVDIGRWRKYVSVVR